MTRFRVASVGEIAGRGRCVAGDVIDDGALKMGMIVRPEPIDRREEGWRIVGIEFADSPSEGAHRLALVLDNAPSLDDLERLLPPGSVLVGEAGAPMNSPRADS